MFSGLFLLIGLVALFFMFVTPVTDIVRARSWAQASCTIDRSQVRYHDDTYSVQVAYHYDRNGVRYTGDRPHFIGGSSGGREAKQAMVDGWVPGQVVLCWVDPDRPGQSVLYRGPTGDLWFALIPGVFVLAGVLALYGSLRAPAPAAAKGTPDPSGVLPAEARVGPEGRTLAPQTTPRLRFVGLLVAALFWNGCVQIFVREVVAGWRAGHRPMLMTLFLLPFVVVGLGLLGAAFIKLLALFSPRVAVTLRPGRLVIGERGDVEWELRGAVERIKRLTVTLEGREEVRDESGETTRVHTAVFARIAVGQGDGHGNLRRGSGRVQVPPGSMHSFTSANNKIVWVLKVDGQIDRWPDLHEVFPVGVVPAAAPPTLT
jgi:hypothetical protein